MKKNVKKYCHFLFDCLSFIVDVVIIIIRSGWKSSFKQEKQDKPVNILANGPSLLESDFRTGDCEYCVLNNSPISPLFWELRPKYYILADPLYFTKNLGEQEKKVYHELHERLDWDLTLFVPYRYRKNAKVLFSELPVQIIPFRGGVFMEISNKSMRHFLYRNGLALPKVQNVVVGAIGCMMGMGFKEINLYGVDHSWTSALMVNDNNIVCLRDSHYYDTNLVKSTPWYKVTGEPYKIHECLRDIANMFASYWELQEFSDTIGVKIVNKTKGSFIDAFERG